MKKKLTFVLLIIAISTNLFGQSYQLDSIIIEIWDSEANEWGYSYKMKELYSYSNNGIISSSKHYDWNRTSNRWTLWNNKKYSYEFEGKIETYIESNWIQYKNEWQPDSKEEYIFDENNRISTQNTYYWNDNENIWDIYVEYDYIYSNDGLLIRDENTTTNNALNRISKYYTEYKYNTDNLLTELTQYYWNNTNQSWNYYNSQYFNYDTNNILINQTYFEEDTARVEFTYNESVLLSECIMPQYEKHPINSNLYKYMLQQAEYCVWNSKQENWEPQSRSTMYYSEQINSSINKLTANIEVYPNPTSDILIIKCSDNFSNAVFQIFDLNGEKLYYNKIKNHTTIDLSWLKNGVYGYSIVSDNTIKKGKILKQ